MTNRIEEDFGRRDLNFQTPKVVEVLPDYFKEDYPKLIELLNAYNDFLDSDGGFNDNLRQLLRARDIDGISLKFLDFLIKETGRGISIDKFQDPRAIARNFPTFFKLKGSLFSAKSFFRALYGEEVEITYPKDQVFIVGESLLGAESLRYIQDGALYQTLSVLIKTSQPISQWRDLYKQYVHPAGFYLGGEVIAEGIVSLNLSTMPLAILDTGAGLIEVSSVAAMTIDLPNEPMTGLYLNSADSTEYRIDLERPISMFNAAPISYSNTAYPSIVDASAGDTMDFSDSDGTELSNDIETIDRSAFDQL